jgi:hypothetical protein
MSSGSAAIQPESEHRLAGLLSVADRLRGWIARLPRADPRMAASVTLMAVVVSAALALMPQRAVTTRQAATPAPRGTEAVPAAPVRIVGAAPRSDNCAEQVWPYIEHRCLTRAAGRPKTSTQAPTAIEPQAGARTTVGAAPPDRGVEVPPAPQQVAAKEPVELPIPPGAVSLPSAPAAGRPPSFAQPGTRVGAAPGFEGPLMGEPRPRMARRAHRSRHGRFSSRRPAFAFPF